MSDDIERDGRKEALINKITKEIGEHRSLGKKKSTTKAIAQFQPEIDALGASIKPGMINWRLREGYIGKSAPKPGPMSSVPKLALECACSYMPRLLPSFQVARRPTK